MPNFPASPELSPPRRIAVFRALQLGDMLCSVPALRALRRAWPDAHVTLIGLPWATRFVERFPSLIDELVVFPGARGFPEQEESDAGLPRFFAAMRDRRFDLAIQMHGSGGPANDIVRQFGAAAYAGFRQPHEARDDGFIAWPEDLPEPHRYLALMRALGIDAKDDALWFPLTPHDRCEYAALETRHGIEPERLIVLHPGAQLPSRRWPAARFAQVADALSANGWQIAITGTSNEAAITAAVLGEMAAPALHLTGSTTLGGLAALVARARLVVCNDTGISHVAAAMRTPSTVIASGSDTRRWAPLDRARHRVLADYPPCRPCAFRDCPYGHTCALNVSVDRVVEAALDQLAHRARAHPAGENVLHARSPHRAKEPGHAT
ncbi:glycosyltransferase family 9 protein [Trinickia sp.]|uniref:glycosyltransferase family 9 protein n=1 Tax=Trinickia sp. TaxID=2571163 RepID=UPI003F7FB94D